jgi:hypothetical protein
VLTSTGGRYISSSAVSDNCDSINVPSVLTTRSCQVPISALVASPYSLPWGSSVLAEVQAYNAYGDSYFSPTGNGAIILTLPDAPVNLSIDPLFTRTATSLSIAWEAGASNGGTPIIGYRVSYDQGVGAWKILGSTTALSYGKTGLVTGYTY